MSRLPDQTQRYLVQKAIAFKDQNYKKYNNDAFKGSDVQVTSEDLKFHFILFLKYSNYQFKPEFMVCKYVKSRHESRKYLFTLLRNYILNFLLSLDQRVIIQQHFTFSNNEVFKLNLFVFYLSSFLWRILKAGNCFYMLVV